MRAGDHLQLGGSKGFPCIARGGGSGIVAGGRFFLPAWYLCGFLFQLLFLYFPFYTSIFVLPFQGLGMLKRVSSLKEEACRLEEEAQHLEMEGLGKVEVAVAGLEVEGFYGLLRGAIAHSSISSAPPLKKAHHISSATVSHLPPQEPTGIIPEVSNPAAMMAEQALEAASPTPEEALG